MFQNYSKFSFLNKAHSSLFWLITYFFFLIPTKKPTIQVLIKPNTKARICHVFSHLLILLSHVTLWFSNLLCYLSTHQSFTCSISLNTIWFQLLLAPVFSSLSIKFIYSPPAPLCCLLFRIYCYYWTCPDCYYFVLQVLPIIGLN